MYFPLVDISSTISSVQGTVHWENHTSRDGKPYKLPGIITDTDTLNHQAKLREQMEKLDS